MYGASGDAHLRSEVPGVCLGLSFVGLVTFVRVGLVTFV